MRGPKLAAVVAAALLVGGCQTLAEEALERGAEAADAGDVEIDLDEDGGSVRVEGEDGSFEQQVGQLPSDFPDGIPLPNGLTIEVGQSIDTDDGRGWMVIAGYDGSCEDFLGFLGGLGSGWTLADNSPQPDCDDDGSDGFRTLTAFYDGPSHTVHYNLGLGDEGRASISVYENPADGS